MWRHKPITVTSGKTKANPSRTTIKAWVGVIHDINVLFPSGCAGLVGVRVQHGITPVHPAHTDEWVVGNGGWVPGKTWYELPFAAPSLDILAYNEDDLFNHKVTVAIGILPKEVLRAAPPAEGVMQRMLKMFQLRE